MCEMAIPGPWRLVWTCMHVFYWYAYSLVCVPGVLSFTPLLPDPVQSEKRVEGLSDPNRNSGSLTV